MADPLSDILELTGAQCAMSGGFYAGPSWAVHFPPPQMIKFITAITGQAWFQASGYPPVSLGTGDVMLINTASPFVLASDLALKPRSAVELFANKADGITRYDEGEDTFLLGGHVTLDAARGHLLRDMLPPFIHVRAEAAEAAILRTLLLQLHREIREGRAGITLATSNLAQLMFLQVLRVYLASAQASAASWLRALADERIARPLRLMHEDPGRAWHLEELAHAASMSRTSFTERFKRVTGTAPLAYLARWRMALAERELGRSDTPVASLAYTLGYTSESAFSHAFKRHAGVAPRQYRLQAQASGRGS